MSYKKNMNLLPILYVFIAFALLSAYNAVGFMKKTEFTWRAFRHAFGMQMLLVFLIPFAIASAIATWTREEVVKPPVAWLYRQVTALVRFIKKKVSF